MQESKVLEAKERGGFGKWEASSSIQCSECTVRPDNRD